MPVIFIAVAIVHSIWQGLLIGAVIAVARPWLRRLPASVHSAILWGALLGMLAAPIVAVSTTLPPPEASAGGAPEVALEPRAWTSWVAVAWLVGVTFFGACTVHGYASLRRLRATGLPLRAWHPRLQELAQRLRVKRPVLLAESPAVSVPMVVGWWRPMILVPLGLLTRLSPLHLEAILLHELAHVRRLDAFANALQVLLEALLFYHPVAWWLSRQIRDVREQCCDDLVVEAAVDPLDYAEALTLVEQLRSATPRLALAASRGPLFRRIERLVHRKGARRCRVPLLVAIVLTLCTSTLVTVGLQAGPWANRAQPRETLNIRWLPPRVKAFEPQIIAAAKRHGVDPALVAIMVMIESSGDASAKSPAGAIGLMQVMPSTAEDIARRRGLPPPDASTLADPETNLDLGTWYLARQLERFGDHGEHGLELAAAAYNGGPARVAAFLRGSAQLAPETIRYRAMVAALWRERSEPRSPTLERLRMR